jgi:hypothetical protein
MQDRTQQDRAVGRLVTASRATGYLVSPKLPAH